MNMPEPNLVEMILRIVAILDFVVIIWMNNMNDFFWMKNFRFICGQQFYQKKKKDKHFATDAHFK